MEHLAKVHSCILFFNNSKSHTHITFMLYLVYRALNVHTGDFLAIKQIEKAVIQPEHLPGILVCVIFFSFFLPPIFSKI